MLKIIFIRILRGKINISIVRGSELGKSELYTIDNNTALKVEALTADADKVLFFDALDVDYCFLRANIKPIYTMVDSSKIIDIKLISDVLYPHQKYTLNDLFSINNVNSITDLMDRLFANLDYCQSTHLHYIEHKTLLTSLKMQRNGVMFDKKQAEIDKAGINEAIHTLRATFPNYHASVNTQDAIQAEKAGFEAIGKVRKLEHLLSQSCGVNKICASKNGVLYPKINQSGTVSGRIASTIINIQGMSNRISHLIKDVNIRFDYSQIEYRLLAHFLIDRSLATIYKQNPEISFHKITQETLNLDYETAKKLNFMIIYGGGVNAVMEALGCDQQYARQLLEWFDYKMPAIKATSKYYEQLAMSGSLQSIGGRMISLVPEKAYTALNQLLQTSCADIMKIVIAELVESDLLQNKDAILIYTKYDELAINYKGDSKNKGVWIKKVLQVMQNNDLLCTDIPILVHNKTV